MTLIIERSDYSHLYGRTDLRDGVGEFNMDVTYPFEQTDFFTQEEFEVHKARLQSPTGNLRTFVIGTMTALLDPDIRRLPDYYITIIESIHQLYENMGVDSYSCFRREKYGAIGITSAHATVLDKLALDTSHFLTVLPGASNSQGTWKEIVQGTKDGTDIVALFRQLDPDMDFRTRITKAAAAHSGRSELSFITYRTPQEMQQGLELVTGDLLSKRAR